MILGGDPSAKCSFIGHSGFTGFDKNLCGSRDDALTFVEFVFDAAQVCLKVKGLDAGFFLCFAHDSGFDVFAVFDCASRELDACIWVLEDEQFSGAILFSGDESCDFVYCVGHMFLYVLFWDFLILKTAQMFTIFKRFYKRLGQNRNHCKISNYFCSLIATTVAVAAGFSLRLSVHRTLKGAATKRI